MIGSHRTIAAAAAFALALAAAGNVVAQDDGAMEGDVIEVTGVEYAFVGLPTSVPAGSSLSFANGGAEVHELALARINDDVTASVEELLQLPEEEALTMVEVFDPLFAGPGETAEGSLPLAREGRYVALCFLPQGLTDASLLEQMGPDVDPETLPPEVAALLESPPHFVLGMIQEFTVTSADSSPGPMPDAADDGSMAEESPASDG